jgi:hypothetical protein
MYVDASICVRNGNDLEFYRQLFHESACYVNKCVFILLRNLFLFEDCTVINVQGMTTTNRTST